MAVPSVLTDLSVSEGSNNPLDSETITASTRPSDYIRALGALLRREQAQFTAVASASSIDLGAITTGNYGHVTGTTTITSFGTVAAGIERTLVFDGILTLTHNATSLILATGANRTTAAGDVAVFVSEGSGNWREKAYHAIGSYQPLDALLTALAAQTTSANTIQAYSGADTPTLLTTGTASGNVPLVGTKSATTALAGLVELAIQAEAEAGTDNTVVMTPLTTAQAIAALAPLPTTLPAGYASTAQTITLGGLLTLAHGLSAAPTLVRVRLECTTGDAGYSIGDIIEINPSFSNQNSGGGQAIYYDATNIYVRFSSAVYQGHNKSTGAPANLTTTSWKLLVYGWA